MFKLVSVITVNWHIYSYSLTLLLSKCPWKYVRFLGLRRLVWTCRVLVRILSCIIWCLSIEYTPLKVRLHWDWTALDLWLRLENSVQYVSISLTIKIRIVRLRILVIGPVQSVTQSRDSNPRLEVCLLRKTFLSISVDAYVAWVAVVCVQTRMLQATLSTAHMTNIRISISLLRVIWFKVWTHMLVFRLVSVQVQSSVATW